MLILGSLACPFFLSVLGKKKTAILGVVLMGTFSIVHYFFGYNSLTPILITNAFAAFGFGLANIAMMSMLADTVEFGQWKSGVRAEGMVFSTNILKTKIATAIGGMLGTLGLAYYLYEPNVDLSIFTMDGIHTMITLFLVLLH